MKPRIAFIAITNEPSPDMDEPVIEVAEKAIADVQQAFGALGAEVMTPVPLVKTRLQNTHCVNWQDAVDAVERANAWKADCIVFLVVAFNVGGVVWRASQMARAPLALWVVPNEVWSLVGGTLDRATLADLGIEHFWLCDAINAENSKKIFDFARGAMLRNALRLKTYGLLGGRAYDMDNTTFDYTQLASQFGVFVHHVDQLELYFRAEKQDPNRVAKETKKITEGKTVDAMPEWVMDRSIRLYLAMRDMAEEYKWDFIGIKDQPELINNYCSACLGMAQMNDDGWVTACECDTSGALTSFLLSLLADEPAYVGDISGLDYETHMLRLANCGAMAMKLARADVPVRLTRQLAVMGATPGICTAFQCRPGTVTVARLQRVAGDYHMLMTSGEAVNRPFSEHDRERWCWPHAFIQLPNNARAIADRLYGNHLNFAYGEYAGALKWACHFLKVEPVQL